MIGSVGCMVSLAGCASEDTGRSEGEGSETLMTSESTADGGTTSTSGNSSTPGSTDSDAAGTSTDANDASSDDEGQTGPGVDARLLPLELGRTWTYDVSTFGDFPVCSPGMHDDAVLGEVQQDGRAAFEVSSFCPAAGTSIISVDGDIVELWVQGGWIRVLDVPVEEGHMWSSTGAIQYVWRDAGTVTVPAGTFDDCWRREQIVSYTAYTVFCRGVGAVRHFSMDLAGAGWDAVLASKSF
jgi:hypothetical protein